MEFTVATTNTADKRVLRVVGEVDVSCADDLRAALGDALATPTPALEVDVEELSYIDSTGIGALVAAAHRAADAGMGFAVVNPQRNVARVLGLLGVAEELGVGSGSAE